MSARSYEGTKPKENAPEIKGFGNDVTHVRYADFEVPFEIHKWIQNNLEQVAKILGGDTKSHEDCKQRFNNEPNYSYVEIEPELSPYEDILEEAARTVESRGPDYGHPLDNHSQTAALWSAFLGMQIGPREVCMLNILQKVSRDAFRPKRDNLVDIAGYARNAEICEGTDPDWEKD